MGLLCWFMASVGIVSGMHWPYSCGADQYVYDMQADLTGKTVVVTGSDGRLGFPLSESLARAGATLVVGSRTFDKAAANKAKLLGEVPSATIDTMVADLSSFALVRAGAASVLSKHRVIDIVIHVAGISGHDDISPDGFDETVEINHLSSALLTNLLLPALKQSSSPRVVYFGSGNLFDPMSWSNELVVDETLQWIRGSPPPKPVGGVSLFYYGLSKLLLANYAAEQARRYPELTVFTVNPGFGRADAGNTTKYADACSTQMLYKPCPQFPAQAVTSAFFAATQSGIESASGSLIDFATNFTSDGLFKQYGNSCIPRPLPPRAINGHQAEWYDAVNAILGSRMMVV